MAEPQLQVVWIFARSSDRMHGGRMGRRLVGDKTFRFNVLPAACYTVSVRQRIMGTPSLVISSMCLFRTEIYSTQHTHTHTHLAVVISLVLCCFKNGTGHMLRHVHRTNSDS